MIFTTSFISFAALAAIEAVSAIAIQGHPFYPEVIPGPGLPSLASLNLTSADLYTMDVTHEVTGNAISRAASFQLECGETPRVPVGNAQACVNYLSSLGTQRCVVGANNDNVVFCTNGNAWLTGSGIGATSSYCRDVASGGQVIVNKCNSNGQVSGANAATGNGNLIVGIEQVGT